MYWYNYECFKKMMYKEVGAHEPTFFIAFTSGAASGSVVHIFVSLYYYQLFRRGMILYDFLRSGVGFGVHLL